MKVVHDPRIADVNYAEFQDTPEPTKNRGLVGAAAFRQENLVVNTIIAMQEPDFKPSDDFDFRTAATESEVFQRRPRAFMNAQSQAEFDYISQKVSQEEADRELLASNGLYGTGLAMVAAIADPTTLLPGGAIYRGARVMSALKSASSVGAMAVAGTAIQEAGLQATQETRTIQESLIAVGAAGILGGALGSVASSFTRKELATIAGGMADNPGLTTILPASHPASIGAAFNEYVAPSKLGDVQGTSPAYGLEKVMGGTNPVIRTIQSPFQTVRNFGASLGTGGLEIDGVANIGGDVESLSKQYLPMLADVLNLRASTIGGTSLTRSRPVKEFNEAVGRALLRGGNDSDPEVQKIAAYIRDDIFAPMLAEGQRLGFDAFNVDPEFSSKYLARNMRGGLIKGDRAAFEDILREHFGEVIQEAWLKKLNRVNEQNAQDVETAELLRLDGPAAQSKREELEKEIARLPQEFPDDVRQTAQKIRDMRAEAREVGGEEGRTLRDLAREVEISNKEKLTQFRAAENKIKRAFKTLDEGRAGLSKKQATALRKAQALEEQIASSRTRLITRIENVLKKIDKLDQADLDKEFDRISDMVDTQFGIMKRAEDKLAQLNDLPEFYQELVDSDIRPTDKISKLEAMQEQRNDKLDRLLERLDEAGSRSDDAEFGRQVLREVMDDAVERAQDLTVRRRDRQQRLRETADKANPELADARALSLESGAKTRRFLFTTKARKLGINAETDDLDVSKYANELSTDLTEKYLGNSMGMPNWAMVNERGSELTRYLKIDEEKVWSNGRKFSEFMELDFENVLRNYLTTLGADFELKRKFGTVNPLDKNSEIMKQLDGEYREALEVARASDDPAGEMQKVAAEFQQNMTDLKVMIDRIRNQRGVPANPDGLLHRASVTARNLNTARLMGKVAISSIPDPGYIVMRHGLTRTFKDGFLPFVKGMKEARMNGNEVKLAGTALDVTLHGRASMMFDTMDQTRNGTMMERGISYAANNIGIVALFDYWTTFMKQVSGNVTIAKVMDDVAAVAEGRSDAGKAAERLSRKGFTSDHINTIWREVNTGDGGGKSNGVWLPSTANWGPDSADARRAFRAAIVRETDDAVVTPGLERPSMMDENEAYRLIFQFRSFTLSMMTKVLLSGVQRTHQGDMAPFLGMMMTLALGGLSYYTWAMTSGEKQRKEMLDASPAKWADEMINRSGVLGPLAEVQGIASRIPATSGFATLSGEAITKSPFNRPLDQIFGPSVGLLTEGNRAAQGDVDSALNLTPYNNLFWAAGFLDAMEK